MKTSSYVGAAVATFVYVLCAAPPASGTCEITVDLPVLGAPPGTTEPVIVHTPWWETAWLLPPVWTDPIVDFGATVWWQRFQYPEGPGDAACETGIQHPIRSEHAYVSFGWTAVVRENNSEDPPVQEDIETGQLYIGGWPSEFDDDLGSPAPTDSGKLLIEGGSLTVAGCSCNNVPNTPYYDPNSPTCRIQQFVGCYERIGYRGTRGEVEQTGGYHEVENSLTFGNGSSCLDPEDPDSLCSMGVYKLTDGTLRSAFMHIGRQGRGEFYMLADPIHAPNAHPHFDGRHRADGITPFPSSGVTVGMVYAYSTAIPFADPPTPIAGHGILKQDIGTFELYTGEFGVGMGRDASENPAIGEVTFGGSASFSTDGHFWVGGAEAPLLHGGEGHVVQEGDADVSVNQLFMLGANFFAIGTYTISGGTLSLIGSGALSNRGFGPLPIGMHVGHLGRGEFTIIGSDSTIEVAGIYSQGFNSQLTLKLGATSPYISTIDVAGSATFDPGATIKIEPQPDYIRGYRAIPILTASGIDGFSNIVLETPSGTSEWELTVDPSGTTLLLWDKHMACGLLGIEPALLLGALHARRRWRRGRGGEAALS